MHKHVCILCMYMYGTCSVFVPTRAWRSNNIVVRCHISRV